MTKIRMYQVFSGNVNEIGYDETRKALRILFKSGGLYEYKGVPMDIYKSLKESGSIGSFISKFIKGIYPYSKIN